MSNNIKFYDVPTWQIYFIQSQRFVNVVCDIVKSLCFLNVLLNILMLFEMLVKNLTTFGVM